MINHKYIQIQKTELSNLAQSKDCPFEQSEYQEDNKPYILIHFTFPDREIYEDRDIYITMQLFEQEYKYPKVVMINKSQYDFVNYDGTFRLDAFREQRPTITQIVREIYEKLKNNKPMDSIY
ncbi:hypothetical protein pb186bvf_011243 [Paramecium bursaria]